MDGIAVVLGVEMKQVARLSSFLAGVLSYVVISQIVRGMVPFSLTSRGLRFHYLALRRLHVSPVFAAWLAWRRKPKVTAVSAITSIMPLLVAVSLVIGVFLHMSLRWRVKDAWSSDVWIVSPSGKDYRKFPLRVALRIVRKRGWSMANTRPVGYMSRWEAVKIVFRGDK